MSESWIKQMSRIAQIFESVLSFNLRRFAILPMEELGLWRKPPDHAIRQQAATFQSQLFDV